MKKILVIGSVLWLSACSAPSADDLVEDPKLLAKIVERCDKLMADGESIDTQECRNAIEASKRLILNNTEKALASIKKNSQIVIKDAKENSAEAVEELEQSAQEALKEAKANADDVLEKARALLQEKK